MGEHEKTFVTISIKRGSMPAEMSIFEVDAAALVTAATLLRAAGVHLPPREPKGPRR